MQYPLPHWRHDEFKGHNEDILALATNCGSSTSNSFLLVTSDFCGEILVWNLVSGHLFKRLTKPGSPISNSLSKIKINMVPAENSNDEDLSDDTGDEESRPNTFLNILSEPRERSSLMNRVRTASIRAESDIHHNFNPANTRVRTPSKRHHCKLQGPARKYLLPEEYC